MDRDKFKGGWGSSNETPCGYGSEIGSTVNIRQAIPIIVQGLNIWSILDAGCGDQHWFPFNYLPHRTQMSYVGVDIFPRNKDVLEFDITSDKAVPSGPYDLVICRDVLIHFTNAQAMLALNNFKRFGHKWLLATTYVGAYNEPRKVEGIRYAPMDLVAPPFNLGSPLMLIPENYPAKFCGLWRL